MMATLALWAALWTIPTGDARVEGLATYYAPGLMQQVAANRGMSWNRGAYVGGVALNRMGDLRRSVWLEREGEVTGPYLVVDCAGRGEHYEGRERRGLVVEVAWEVSQAWGMEGPVPVVVHFEPPAPEGKVMM